jgi:hypothetical protein
MQDYIFNIQMCSYLQKLEPDLLTGWWIETINYRLHTAPFTIRSGEIEIWTSFMNHVVIVCYKYKLRGHPMSVYRR